MGRVSTRHEVHLVSLDPQLLEQFLPPSAVRITIIIFGGHSVDAVLAKLIRQHALPDTSVRIVSVLC